MKFKADSNGSSQGPVPQQRFRVGDKVKFNCSRFPQAEGTVYSFGVINPENITIEITKPGWGSDAPTSVELTGQDKVLCHESQIELLPQPQDVYDPNNYVDIYCSPGFELGTDYWPEKSSCNHSWKRYEGLGVGLTRVVDYCVHCNEERGV